MRRSTGVLVGAAIALVIGTLGSTAASADPGTDPHTSQDAKQAWQDSSHQAEIAAEQLNGSRVAQTRADQAAARAAAGVTAAKKNLEVAHRHVSDTSKVVASYQGKLDAFASASFRGARLGEMSVLLTAQTADDFLDQSSAIDRVAADTHRTMTEALTAKANAAPASTAAAAAEQSAERAEARADAARAAAVTAATAARDKKADLDATVTKYQTLFEKLSAQEQAAAEAAAARAKAESEASARAAAAAAAAVRVAAAPVADQRSPDSAASAGGPDASSSNGSSASSSNGNSSNSVTPATTSQKATTSQAAASSPAAGAGGDSLGQIAAQAAMTKIGGGYCYACDGPNSFDCSGLTTWAWAQAGISIPRVSYEQANFPQVPLDQLQPGDLVTYYSPVSHVAIYVGNGMVVSAADESLGILYRPVERGGPDATGHRVPRG